MLAILKKHPYFILLPSIALLAFLLFSRNVTLTYDSYNFLCGAHSFLKNSKILMCDRTPMVLSPPGYSILLSAFLTGLTSLHTAYLFYSLIIYGITLFVWIKIMKMEIKDKTILVFAFLQILVALPLFYVHLFIWSEGTFMLFLTLGVFFLLNFRNNGDWKWLICSVCAFCLAITLRYAGFFIFTFLLIGYNFSEGARFKVKHYLALLLPAFVMGTVVFRNFYLTGLVLGARPFIKREFGEILYSVSAVIAKWIIPVLDFHQIPFLVLIIFFGSSIFYFSMVRVYFIPFVLYFIFIVISAYRTDIEYDERLFVPVYPLFLLVIMKTCEGFVRNRRVNFSVYTFLGIWTAYSIMRLAKNVYIWMI